MAVCQRGPIVVKCWGGLRAGPAQGGTLDADRIRLGETGFEELLEWLRGTHRPQTLEALTYQYLTILRDMVLEEGKA